MNRPRTKWVFWQGPVICSVCSHRHRMVIPIPEGSDGPADGSECPACRSMACVVADDDALEAGYDG